MARRVHRPHRPVTARLVAAVAVSALCATAALAAGGSPVGATDLGTSGLAGNAVVRVDTAPGLAVGVVAWSAPVDDRVAVVIENGSDDPVAVRKVEATATNAAGARSVRATTRTAVPRVLQPGEQALGSIRFRKGSLHFDDTFNFDVVSGKVRSADPVALATGDFTLSSAGTGPVAQTLGLVVTNDSTRTINGTVRVQVVCLNEAGTPTTAASTTVRKAKLAPDATMPASVDFELLCPAYVVGAEGRAGQ